jgi:hypothetical protein
VTRSPRSITRLRICWVVHRPSALVVMPSRCTDRVGTSNTNKHVDPLERYRAVDVEEVTGQHRRRLRAQELPPSRVGVAHRCRRDPQPPQHAADRGRSHPVTEFEQLPLDSSVPPARVVLGHARNQHGDSILDRRTPDTVGISPPVGNQATMPAHDRARCDQSMSPQPRRQPSD